MLRAPAAHRRRDVEAHAALRRELEGVGQQVLEHLLQPLGVGDDAAAEIGIDVHIERQLPVLGLVPERARHHLEQVGEQDVLGLDRDGAGFDLRQIEDVADQIQEIGAGAVNGARELDLLAGQVAFRILGELLAQNQDAVERRAQLVRHVGQELRLVARGERQLGRLLLDRAARLLDLLVLALHLDVALGQLLGLLLQLLVGLLQLLLLRLQLAGELLRLLEQPFGLHRRLDAVEHDADAGGQLLQEGGLQRGEGADGGELDHGLDLALEQDRQHDDVVRRDLEQGGADRDGARRHLGDQHTPPVGGTLADQSFPEAQGWADGRSSRRPRRPTRA